MIGSLLRCFLGAQLCTALGLNAKLDISITVNYRSQDKLLNANRAMVSPSGSKIGIIGFLIMINYEYRPEEKG
ncbi:MAG: hypothetical protein CMQ19_01530 [Gammaproteobacteria bacterium]|nr:hypothetical protein [Gammaproteobacteria bacterium]|tara:strand:- start:1272 stop:1490 length:219 start_codon:yes stop_codon:yes gene_type:complete